MRGRLIHWKPHSVSKQLHTDSTSTGVEEVSNRAGDTLSSIHVLLLLLHGAVRGGEFIAAGHS